MLLRRTISNLSCIEKSSNTSSLPFLMMRYRIQKMDSRSFITRIPIPVCYHNYWNDFRYFLNSLYDSLTLFILEDSFCWRVEFFDTIEDINSRNYYFDYPFKWFISVSMPMFLPEKYLLYFLSTSFVSEIIAAATVVWRYISCLLTSIPF